MKESFERMLGQFWILYAMTGLFLLLGCVAWFLLGNHRVGVDEKGNEWIEAPGGRVVLDERRSETARAIKKANLVSKLFQVISR